MKIDSLKIVFRVDSSLDISSGHVMRCLALASVMKKKEDTDIKFISRMYEGNLNDLVIKQGFQVAQLKNPFKRKNISKNFFIENRDRTKYSEFLGISQKQDAKDTIGAIGEDNVDWIILDHYSLDDTWKFYMRPYTKNIFEIDDNFREVKNSDVILNQAPIEVSKKNYKNKITPKTKLLLGPKYAIIDRTYISVRKNLKPREGEINRILVFYGGVDKANETTKALNAINNLDLSEIFIDVVIGESNIHRDKIVNQVNIVSDQ